MTIDPVSLELRAVYEQLLVAIGEASLCTRPVIAINRIPSNHPTRINQSLRLTAELLSQIDEAAIQFQQLRKKSKSLRAELIAAQPQTQP